MNTIYISVFIYLTPISESHLNVRILQVSTCNFPFSSFPIIGYSCRCKIIWLQTCVNYLWGGGTCYLGRGRIDHTEDVRSEDLKTEESEKLIRRTEDLYCGPEGQTEDRGLHAQV